MIMGDNGRSQMLKDRPTVRAFSPDIVIIADVDAEQKGTVITRYYQEKKDVGGGVLATRFSLYRRPGRRYGIIINILSSINRI